MKDMLIVILGLLVIMIALSKISEIGTKDLDYMPRAVLGEWKNSYEEEHIRYLEVNEQMVDVITEEGEAMRCIVDNVTSRSDIFGSGKATTINCRTDTGSAVTFSNEICDGGRIYEWRIVFEQDISEDVHVEVRMGLSGDCGEDGHYALPRFRDFFDRVEQR